MAETRDSSFPRDLLQRFMCTHFPVKPKEETLERLENVELSLGLSLNGRFGVEPQRMLANGNNNSNNKLFRASSVVDFVNFPADVELSLYSPLTRTCSLPPETATEWRNRKELQTFRRSEAKRKREEKMKNVRVVKGKIGEDGEGNRRNSTGEIELWGMGMKQSPASPPSPAPLGFSSQGSIVSQGSGGSSGVSDFESQAFPGISKDTEVKSTTRECSVPIQIPPKIISGFNRSRKIDAPMEPLINNSSRLVNAHLPTDMPCVSTKGDGPDGKKIQGFLYRYGNGEEVRIVCVCHGSFLTPSEFVKHGGGGDVENPLRHIIVSSSFCI